MEIRGGQRRRKGRRRRSREWKEAKEVGWDQVRVYEQIRQ